jgi:hypothetical protein
MLKWMCTFLRVVKIKKLPANVVEMKGGVGSPAARKWSLFHLNADIVTSSIA